MAIDTATAHRLFDEAVRFDDDGMILKGSELRRLSQEAFNGQVSGHTVGMICKEIFKVVALDLRRQLASVKTKPEPASPKPEPTK